MSDPARQLKVVGEASQTMHGVARQALDWVRVSEERVAAAEARTEKVRAELKQRALETVRGFSEEGRKRIGAEREARRQAESRLSGAEQGRDRAEKAFEDLQRRAQIEREELVAQVSQAKAEAEKTVGEARTTIEREVERQLSEARAGIERQAVTAREAAAEEADRRVAAAEP